MLRKILALLLFAGGSSLVAQVPISASAVVDSFEIPIPLARLCFQPVNAAISPTGFRVGSDQIVPNEVCGKVTTGVLQSGLGLAPNPSGTYYHIYAKSAFANSIIRDYGLAQISGSSWSLDSYDPSVVSVPASALTMGTVTTLSPGSGGFCSLSTSASGPYLLNCSIPQGTAGANGTNGTSGTNGVQGPQGNTGAGQLTAAQVMPDTLAAPTTAYPSQASAIASVTDTNAKTALTALNNSFLSLQAALQNNGIVIPNTLQAAIAACSACGVYPFNPAGLAIAPTTVSNVLATGNTATFTYSFATGEANFVPGGRGPGQWGYITAGNVGSGPNIAIPAPQVAGAASVSQGQLNITSTSQIQGGGTLSTYFYAVPTASNTTVGTLAGTSGGTISVASMVSDISWVAGGSVPVPGFAITMTKTSDNGVGNGQCQEWNTATSAYVTYTFPTSYIANSSSLVPPNSFNLTTLVDHGNGTWTCYLNDALGNFASPLQTSTTSVTSAFAWKAVAPTAGAFIQGPLYFPGIQFTPAQVAGLYCGFTSTGSCGGWQLAPNTWTANAYTSLSGQPAVNWQTHTFVAADPFLRDCPYFTAYTNGGLSGTGSYNGTWSHCHAVFSTNAPSVRASTVQGLCQTTGCPTSGFSVHVDGVLAENAGLQSANGVSYIDVALPNDGAFHTVDVNAGGSAANTTPGFSPAQQYASLSDFFLKDVAIPNNQQYQMLSVAQTGTTTLCITDSILCSGFNTLPNSAIDSFLPMWRYGTSPPTPNIAAIGAGGFLLSTDFDTATSPTAITTAGGGSGYPTAQATTWIANNVAPVATGGVAANVTTALIARGINDFSHLASVFGATVNCIGIEASSIKNALAALKAYNSGMTIHLFSLLNSGAYVETGTDTCTGDIYTTTTALTAETLVGGVWTPTAISAGTVISGAASRTQWRIMQQDMCLTSGNCDYFEVGPGAPGITGSGRTYYPPDLSGKLSTGTQVAGGTGYVTGDTWCPTQTGAYGGCFTVTAVSGAITALTIKTSGRNYATASALSGTTSGAGTGATANITAVAGTAADMNTDALHPTPIGHYELAQCYSAKYASGAWTFKQFN